MCCRPSRAWTAPRRPAELDGQPCNRASHEHATLKLCRIRPIDPDMAASTPRLRSLLILAIALIGTLVGLMVSAGHKVPLPIRVLRGVTRQKTSLYLAVRGGRAVGVKTSLSASCGDGSTWAAKWSPAEGHPVHFIASGNSFSTNESIKLTYTHGVTGSAQFQFQGQLTGVT